MLAFLVLLMLLGPAGGARASEGGSDGADSLGSGAGRPLLGGVLEWGADDAAGFAERLKATPAVLGHEISLPITESDRGYVREFLSQSAATGAHALLTVKPTIPLAAVDAAKAGEFARDLESLASGFPGKLLIRFAPDMNSGWTAWGQQPEAYVPAFRAVAQAFESRDNALMLWQPFLGRDYPFGKNRSAPAPGTAGFVSLDTNSDGVWNGADDPYAPYYPGDAAVDLVGLSAYHDDTGGGAAVNTLPSAGELAAMLTGADFYGAYSTARDKPLLLQTAAYFSPTAGGPAEVEIKSAWWKQVLAEAASARFDRIGAVVWDEKTNTRDTGDLTIDWRLTGRSDVSAAAAAAVRQSSLVTGPVTGTVQGLSGDAAGSALAGTAVWVAAVALFLAAGLLWLVPLRSRLARKWTYRDSRSRDSRVDMLRGMAIILVVVNHIGVTSLFQLFTQEAIGFVSGAELFVLLSGLVLGMVYGPKARDGFGDVASRTSRRAGKLYVTALTVVAAVFVISLLPGVNADALTTFTDQGTGGAGRSGAGRTYDLFGGMQALLQFPVPAGVIPAILLLQFGPWQFNVMGLYVVMLLISPLILAGLTRGKAAWILAGSVTLYAAGSVFRFRLLPSQFEDSFPLLVWQVLFVLGLVGGYYRRQIVAWLAAHRWLIAGCTVLTAGFAFLSWANPYLANEFDVRLQLLPDAGYRSMYDHFFGRTYLGPGRLLNVLALLVTAYALLTAYWKPVEKAIGWLLIPLGQATLYVFIIHVLLIAVVANIPLLQEGHIWLNTAAYAAIIVLLWVMVRKRFLFGIIPT